MPRPTTIEARKPMAVYWNLGALCATEPAAEAFEAYFRGRSMPGPGGEPIPLDVGTTRVGELWLVGVWAEGMNWGSPKGSDHRLTEPEALRKATSWFYEELRGAPPFRVAQFGAEAFDWFLSEPFPWSDPEVPPGSGFVLDRAAWEALGCPDGGEPFGEAYRWWPPLPRDE